jgi:hypothetical protein
MTSGSMIDSSAVLAAARRARAAADAAEVEVLAQALAWAELHVVSSVEESATWGDSPIPLAGEGAPLVSEFCVMEFAAALGLSTDAGRSLIAHALEIAHRLPLVWARVQAGSLQVWRARRVAEQTIGLSAEAAGYVDRQVAPYAHRMGPAATERLVDQAIGLFMPQLAEEIAEHAADGRHLTIDHRSVSFAGTSRISGELDLADALDLEKALQHGAQQLADLGIEAHLDARRAMALGALARGDQALDLETPAPAPHRRRLELFVHLNGDTETAMVENAGTHLITKDQVAEWARIPGTQVTIRPVIDLNHTHTTPGYDIPDRIRDHIILRDRTCVFPWCTRPARSADIDHIEPYEAGGQTSTTNLAALCRRHHRLKTFGSWTYTQIEPGTFLWRSPHGYSYLRDQTGTRDLTPRPVDPPG